MSTNVINKFNKEEFTDSYSTCNKNDNGGLECQAIEHTSPAEYPNCYPTIKSQADIDNTDSVGQCVYSLYTNLINNNLQDPSIQFDKNSKPMLSKNCLNYSNAATSINDYCNNKNNNTDPPTYQTPEINPLIYNAPQNGLGQVCSNNNNAITAPLNSKYTFTNTYKFNSPPLSDTHLEVGCHDMLSLKSKCTKVNNNNKNFKTLLYSYINGGGVDWNDITESPPPIRPNCDADKDTCISLPGCEWTNKICTNIKTKIDYFESDTSKSLISTLNNLDQNIANQINNIKSDSGDLASSKAVAMTTLSNLFKAGMCQVAKDNIENTKYTHTVFTIADWWEQNIYANGFQQNIYMVCFFVCMYFKFKILSTFPINDFINKTSIYKYILPVMAIIWSVIILIFFNSENTSFLTGYFTYTMYLFAIVICSSSIIRLTTKVKSQLYKSNSMKLLIFLIVLIILCYSIITIMFDFRNWLLEMCIFFFLFFILIYTTFRKKNLLPNYYLLMILLFLGIVVYFWVGIMKTDFYSSCIGDVNKGLKIGWFYIIVFLLLLLLFTFNSPLLSSNKAQAIANYMNTNTLPSKNGVLKGFGKVILIIYFIIAIAGDTFLSVFCPQLTLALLVLFRLITDRWYEPLNAMFSALSGYYMNYGTSTSTENAFIL